jgi:hypothetical protein
MGIKQQKSKATYSLYFSSILSRFFNFENEAKNSKNVRLYIAFTFGPFIATFFIFHKWAKNSKK